MSALQLLVLRQRTRSSFYWVFVVHLHIAMRWRWSPIHNHQTRNSSENVIEMRECYTNDTLRFSRRFTVTCRLSHTHRLVSFSGAINHLKCVLALNVCKSKIENHLFKWFIDSDDPFASSSCDLRIKKISAAEEAIVLAQCSNSHTEHEHILLFIRITVSFVVVALSTRFQVHFSAFECIELVRLRSDFAHDSASDRWKPNSHMLCECRCYRFTPFTHILHSV